MKESYWTDLSQIINLKEALIDFISNSTAACVCLMIEKRYQSARSNPFYEQTLHYD